jgi:competence protein ComEA
VEPSGAPWRVLDAAEPDAAGVEPVPRPFPWPAVAAAAVAAAVALGAFLLATRSDPVVGVEDALPHGAEVSAAPSSTGVAGRAAVGELVVEVGGAVGHPGVYRLPAGARVGDAIAAAGGYAPRVDAAEADRRLNLAAPLRDGEEVHVPARGEAAGDSSGGVAGDAPGGRLIDVNTASAAQLDTLPGVGPATAAKIITAREAQRFASVDELRTRKVVGEATLEKIRALGTVGP